MANAIENERWRAADQAADFLSVDREVCRRAFHEEPEHRVRDTVRWVLAKRDIPGHDDPEWMLESWAREHGAGVYRKDRPRDDLECVEKIVARAMFKRDAVA